jgi:hypothetical protein
MAKVVWLDVPRRYAQPEVVVQNGTKFGSEREKPNGRAASAAENYFAGQPADVLAAADGGIDEASPTSSWRSSL